MYVGEIYGYKRKNEDSRAPCVGHVHGEEGHFRRGVPEHEETQRQKQVHFPVAWQLRSTHLPHQSRVGAAFRAVSDQGGQGNANGDGSVEAQGRIGGDQGVFGQARGGRLRYARKCFSCCILLVHTHCHHSCGSWTGSPWTFHSPYKGTCDRSPRR